MQKRISGFGTIDNRPRVRRLGTFLWLAYNAFSTLLASSRDRRLFDVYTCRYMAQEINLGGTIYISSKRAAEITEYTQDYIGQLARGGHIIAQRVSGLWYVVEASIRDYKVKADEFKPTPPPYETPATNLEASVSFDGKDYVSTQRAAAITGYHQDYVGQLARSGKILSRQIGDRWHVDREGLVAHKKHNDALLAAVQAESVGLLRENTPIIEAKEDESDLHFNYLADEKTDFLPEMESRFGEMAEINDISDEDSVNEIPIRVIRPRTMEKMPRPEARFVNSLISYRSSNKTLTVVILTTIGITVVIGAYIFSQSRGVNGTLKGYATGSIEVFRQLHGSITPDFIQDFFGKVLYYRRDSF